MAWRVVANDDVDPVLKPFLAAHRAPGMENCAAVKLTRTK